METQTPKINSMFLIGAGFTKAVFPNAPLNKDLFHAVVSSNPKSKLSLYSKKYGTEDIEVLLTRLDTDIVETESNILERDRKSIETDLCEYFAKFRFTQDKLDHNAWLEKFALSILRESDDIVTTNYDCFLEGLLDFCKVWSPKEGYVNIENPLLDSPDNSKNILIYKIHGSENFRMQRFADNENKKSIAFKVDENEGIFPRSAKNKHFGCLYDKGRYIIAPSFVKIPHVQIADMINKTAVRAALAQNLVIGGSSLRQEDNSLWLILTSFLNKELEIKKKLIILDPDSQRIAKKLDCYWIGGTKHYTTTLIASGFSHEGIEELQQVLQGNGMFDSKDESKERLDFIRQIVAEDLTTNKWDGRVVTRFPPEPNGYLHIGHAKSICLNFGIAAEFGGRCHLRFDDTNPEKEEQEYVNSIIEDVRWLGWDWGEHLYYGSDYFQQMYEYAVQLIQKGKAYVCDLTAEETRVYRGTLTEPGRDSPYRSRSVEENLDLFERMKAGEFPDGSRTLRAKIDMAHPNLNMRDPVMYRILHAAHHRTGETWCIYPMYDWAHGLEDSVERITHSICTLEFENHRPLYDWFLDELGAYHPQQIEFARLNLTYTVMSKRRLLQLVQDGLVSGWDDPRMPTISGIRRRGYSPEAVREFCRRIGVNKFNSTVDIALLEHCLREDLNKTSPRVMAVLRPLKVVIDNYPEDQVEELDAINNPEDPSAGTRKVPFSRELYIEREDFMEEPPKKFFRLAPGREVRLRYAYFITCTDVVKDETGNIVELHCTYDPATRGGDAPDGRKVKSTLHWVSVKHALEAEVRLYDHLFTKEDPDDVAEGEDFKSNLNPSSLEVLTSCRVEPSLAEAKSLSRYQFERMGYFCVDPDSAEGTLVFNRTVGLRDTWAKIQKSQQTK